MSNPEFKSDEERQAARDFEVKQREERAREWNRTKLSRMEKFVDQEVKSNNIPGVTNATESDAARQLGKDSEGTDDIKIDYSEVDVAHDEAILAEHNRKKYGIDPR